jgi:hypothetical protein
LSPELATSGGTGTVCEPPLPAAANSTKPRDQHAHRVSVFLSVSATRQSLILPVLRACRHSLV